MAELTPRERLLPSLLDRLTDDNPGDVSEARERRAETMVQLRSATLRDLEWLLNTSNIESEVNLSEYPELGTSVINYGLPNLAGNTVTSVDFGLLESSIRKAIQAYECRILQDTVRVTSVLSEDAVHANSVTFKIEGTLWGNPMPEPLFLRTEVDLEIGEVVLKESDD